MVYCIPVRVTGEAVPVNAIRIVGAKVEDYGLRVVFTVLGTPSENLPVMFSVQQTSAKQ